MGINAFNYLLGKSLNDSENISDISCTVTFNSSYAIDHEKDSKPNLKHYFE